MIVHGFVVSSVVQCELIARMMREPFTAHDIEMCAFIEGIPLAYGKAMHAADRLIQQQRKAGHIVREGRGWRWVG